MQYAYCSMKSVIGDVIRNTRLQDASYIADAHEWVYQAMELMQTQVLLQGHWEDITMDYHKAKLPCDLVWIDAVEYNSHRLMEGGGARPADRDCPVSHSWDDGVFQSEIQKVETIANHFQYIGKITKVQSLAHSREYYYTDMGSINTSFESGKITIYYRRVGKDKDGLPLIPNNRNYKLALYWFCRAMMIGAGYEDKQFTYEKAMNYFEDLYAPRAMGEITYPSPERMERLVNAYVRLQPDAGYYDNFFSASAPEAPYILNI